jgi:hypothetical protein
MWPPEKIAATAVFLAHEMHGLALPSQDGKGFCQLANITDEELRGEWRRVFVSGGGQRPSSWQYTATKRT